MKRFLSFLLFVLLLAVAVLSVQLWKERAYLGYGWKKVILGLLHGGSPARHRPEKYTVADGPRINLQDVDVLAAMSRQRVLLARAVIPSVVSITTLKTVRSSGNGEDPFFQFFHRGMQQGGSATQKALGSGAIVSREGHIVTNNHVIDGMDEIEVRLSDGRLMPATMIGADPDTDIAILKIDADNLQPLPLGDSDAVEVGETVMAVGNPYGLDESVSQGIISAKGRRGSENISDLFQTDAAVNPGNSGGPLVNVRGELIGVNEAIFSPSGGWLGVGFAIPAATVRGTMETILRTGRVIHGYLGVYQLPAAEDALRQRGFGDEKGVLVDSVVNGSPAEKADIQPGDFIQKFDGKPVNDYQDLRHGVAAVALDTTVPIELLRGGKKIRVMAMIAERPPLETQLSQFPHYRQPFIPPLSPGTLPESEPRDASMIPGILVADLPPAFAQKMNLPRDLQGVVVRQIEPGAPAAAKLQLGDIIEKINQQPVTSVAEFARIVRALTGEQPAVFSVVRDRSRTLVILGHG